MPVCTMRTSKKVSSRTETSLEYTYLRTRRHVALITPDLVSGWS